MVVVICFLLWCGWRSGRGDIASEGASGRPGGMRNVAAATLFERGCLTNEPEGGDIIQITDSDRRPL